MSYAEQLFDLTGHVVLITGSRGLGKEMAYGVARCGADVVIASRKMENCVAIAEDIERERAARQCRIRCTSADGINSTGLSTRPTSGSARSTR